MPAMGCADGMFEYAKSKGLEWGTIDTIPEIPGIAVRYAGHVGIYIGNGEVIEERGFKYGCVKTKLKDRKWLHWYKIPTIKYNTSSTIPEVKVLLGDRLLQYGSKGDDVKELQAALNKLLGLNLTVDGQFGANTQAAVKKFQAKFGLAADGQYGAKSHATLMTALAENEPNVEIEPAPAAPVQSTTLKANCTANIRTGDSTSYSIPSFDLYVPLPCLLLSFQ